MTRDNWAELRHWLRHHLTNGEYIIKLTRDRCPSMVEALEKSMKPSDDIVKEVLDKMDEIEGLPPKQRPYVDRVMDELKAGAKDGKG
jgi:hypothetical protein